MTVSERIWKFNNASDSSEAFSFSAELGTHVDFSGHIPRLPGANRPKRRYDFRLLSQGL
jgi:hypothetical protein